MLLFILELVKQNVNAHGTSIDDYARDCRCHHHEHGYVYGCVYVRENGQYRHDYVRGYCKKKARKIHCDASTFPPPLFYIATPSHSIDTHSQCDIIRLSKMQTQSSHGLTSACIFRFLRREPCRQQQIVHPQLYLKNFISNRREQPAWAAKRNSSTIPVFRSTKSSTSPGASCLTSSPTTKAKKVSGSFGSGWLSVKRIRRKERKGKSKQVTAQGTASLAAPFLMQQALHSRI